MHASKVGHVAVRLVSAVLMGALAVPIGGCFSLRAYETGALGSAPPARVVGDYRLRAGALVNVFLRSVDDQPLQFWQYSADMDAGAHRLLVDCEVTATGKLSRHVLNVLLENGVRYRLSAEASDQQGCTRVSLEELD